MTLSQAKKKRRLHVVTTADSEFAAQSATPLKPQAEPATLDDSEKSENLSQGPGLGEHFPQQSKSQGPLDAAQNKSPGVRSDGFSADGTRKYGSAESTSGFGSRASAPDFEEGGSQTTPHRNETTPGSKQDLWDQ